ncbi:GNAT family N-acetyltransferase [Jeotgalibacillus sp. ET6]|uniref:GNAT family N-acetyltransferase n=1 Tax=Jeotgalibacillus sp. ET6 TaxID=3037260 RepID=UPI0024186E4E|nr:GNAT family N-acetyltransferase [Jeotgalibacillus sp. ET6]MDG5471270.1 GNAT family N-acetyltransferase [Jeotgalibacillus sp. ET6]
MEIRVATINDIPELVVLMDQLGYPTSFNKMESRFNAILSDATYQTLVADFEGNVVGMAGLRTNLSYEYDDTYVQIVAFVIDSNYRRKGIGEKLIQRAEKWAKEQGAIAIGLNSGNREERKGAHQFYIEMGYKNKSIGFSKDLV